MTALACQEPGCATPCADFRALSNHLITDHLLAPSVAIPRARKIADAASATANGHAPAPATTAPAIAPPTQEIPMPTKPHKPDPASCKLCSRVNPEKCKRHGGGSHSTSFGGNGTRRSTTNLRPDDHPTVVTAKVATNGHFPNGQVSEEATRWLLTKIDEEIADTTATLRALERLRSRAMA
jgi:hypothetical protein